MVRVAVLGDSEEASPGGMGYAYIPRLNYEAWRRFGNVPESFVAAYGSYGGGTPWGEWLLRGGAAAPGASPTRIAPERLLPNIQVAAHSTNAGDRNVNGQWYGQLPVLRQDAASVAPEALVSTGANYFCTGGAVRAEIFAATYPDSGEVHYIARPIDTITGDYFALPTAQGTLTMGLAAANYAIKSMTTSPLPYAGHRYLQLELLGSSNTALTDIIGVRFKSDACPQGMVFQGFASGGYTTIDFLTRHWDAGALFRALGFHAAVLHLGANDAGRGITAETYKVHTEQLITMLRAWMNDPAFPIVLMSDPFRAGWPPTIQEEFNRFAGAHFAIALADPNVLVINSRRLMDDRGWKEARPDRIAEVLLDNVHYTPQGAIELAGAEITTLLGP
ncbi:MAG: SGNH/GDSL hydrolase family protein [Nitrospiraceae bacterium]|nr:SGNH/GDSL hydrolase family protein [Nitrospiraceae bacterium]